MIGSVSGYAKSYRVAERVTAAPPEQAEALYRSFVAEVRGQGIEVATGRFQVHMDVALVNDGPVTLLLDSRKRF